MSGDSPEPDDISSRSVENPPQAILRTPRLSVFHESAKPGGHVKPHRHGTHQFTYVLHGKLIFDRRRVGPGMGFTAPDLLSSWRAGDESARWPKIHAGRPGLSVGQRD